MDIMTIRKGTVGEGPSVPSRMRALVAQRGAGIGLEILFNFLLPFLVYSVCEARLGPAQALMVAAIPPLVWAAIEFIRRRRIDAISILVLAGVALSLLVFVSGGSIRILQLREKMITAIVGLVFLSSAAIGRPLMYQLGRSAVRRRSPAEVGGFEALKENVDFRRTMMTLTWVWGSALVLEAAVATLLVFTFSVRQYLLVGPVLGYATMGTVGGWSFLYVHFRRRKALAREAGGAGTGASGQPISSDVPCAGRLGQHS